MSFEKTIQEAKLANRVLSFAHEPRNFYCGIKFYLSLTLLHAKAPTDNWRMTPEREREREREREMEREETGYNKRTKLRWGKESKWSEGATDDFREEIETRNNKKHQGVSKKVIGWEVKKDSEERKDLGMEEREWGSVCSFVCVCERERERERERETERDRENVTSMLTFLIQEAFW